MVRGRLWSFPVPACLCSHSRLLSLFPQMKETIMNQEKLAKLQAQVRIGGKVGVPAARISRLARCVLEVGVGSGPECSQLQGKPCSSSEVACIGAICSS